MAAEITRWALENVDRAKNVSKYYILYVIPHPGGATEVRHWGRRGTAGRSEPFAHDTVEAAMESARQKAYAELGKGYKEIAQDTFPLNVESHGDGAGGYRFEPTALAKAAKKHQDANAELGLTNSEIDSWTRDAQTLLVALQDPQTGIDIDRVEQLKTTFHSIETQFGRASATMKMIDLLCAARLQRVGT